MNELRGGPQEGRDSLENSGGLFELLAKATGVSTAGLNDILKKVGYTNETLEGLDRHMRYILSAVDKSTEAKQVALDTAYEQHLSRLNAIKESFPDVFDNMADFKAYVSRREGPNVVTKHGFSEHLALFLGIKHPTHNQTRQQLPPIPAYVADSQVYSIHPGRVSVEATKPETIEQVGGEAVALKR